MNVRSFHITMIIWLFAPVCMGFAESFPDRPTVAEMNELVRLGTECIHGVNERYLAVKQNPPFVRPNPEVGWYLDASTMATLASTIRALVPNYVDPDTVYNGSPNIAMQTVPGLWAELQIGDQEDQFTATPAGGMTPATYGDNPWRIVRLHLVERGQVLEALNATTLAVDIFERRHGSDYSGKTYWSDAISSAEKSFTTNGGGRGPYGKWDTYSAATWSSYREMPWYHYEVTVLRVVKGGLSIVYAPDVIDNLSAIRVYMSATNYTGGEIGEQNSVFDDNGLSGLTDDWKWNQVGSFFGPFSIGQQVLFINNTDVPARCGDPQGHSPPGSLQGYVTKSPDPGGVQRDPLGVANWWFTYCRYPL